jgi:hypothetical protein
MEEDRVYKQHKTWNNSDGQIDQIRRIVGCHHLDIGLGYYPEKKHFDDMLDIEERIFRNLMKTKPYVDPSEGPSTKPTMDVLKDIHFTYVEIYKDLVERLNQHADKGEGLYHYDYQEYE